MLSRLAVEMARALLRATAGGKKAARRALVVLTNVCVQYNTGLRRLVGCGSQDFPTAVHFSHFSTQPSIGDLLCHVNNPWRPIECKCEQIQQDLESVGEVPHIELRGTALLYRKRVVVTSR